MGCGKTIREGSRQLTWLTKSLLKKIVECLHYKRGSGKRRKIKKREDRKVATSRRGVDGVARAPFEGSRLIQVYPERTTREEREEYWRKGRKGCLSRPQEGSGVRWTRLNRKTIVQRPEAKKSKLGKGFFCIIGGSGQKRKRRRNEKKKGEVQITSGTPFQMATTQTP